MLCIASSTSGVIALPRRFGMDTMYGLISKAINQDGDARHATIEFDFSKLEFIDPAGVVVMSNLIEYLRHCRVSGRMSNVWLQSAAVRYLDDCGFFVRYNNGPLQVQVRPRDGTLPLTLVENIQATNFIYQRLIPWMALQLGTTDASLATVRVCMEEILQNIADHSGRMVGCVHAQYFPQKSELDVVVSDFGFGIPHNVRNVVPDATDAAALHLACQEGFTTQSNVRNRGAGLATLIRYVTGRDHGAVWIVSGKANISAVHASGESRLTSRTKPSAFPGTLVRVLLKANAIPDLAKDVEAEEFSW